VEGGGGRGEGRGAGGEGGRGGSSPRYTLKDTYYYINTVCTIIRYFKYREPVARLPRFKIKNDEPIVTDKWGKAELYAG